MRCPQCGERETRVVDSRDLDDSATIRRRRECSACATRFTTYERVEAARLVVVKRDGIAPGVRPRQARLGAAQGADPPAGARRGRRGRRRRDRGRAALVRASPRSRRRGSARWRWSSSAAIDQIAYIRFASVYQSFEDLEELKREVDTLYDGDAATARRLRRVSVLSDRDIRAALEAGEVRIDPYDPQDLQPSSVDLHLDRSFRVFRNNRYPYIDVRAPQPDLTELLTIADDEPFILHPGEFVLGQTLEWVELPDDLVAQARGQELAGPARPAHPLDRGLRRPGLEGQPDARAVERRQPAHRALLRHAHRPDLVLQDVVARSSGRTGRPSCGRATRARRSRPPRPSTGTSTKA